MKTPRKRGSPLHDGNAKSRRAAWERITRVDNLIRAGKFPNCAGMAKEFGVSVRTLARDIEFMQQRLELPIEYNKKRWGFFYSKPTATLPKAPITEAELFAILIAQKSSAQYSGTPFEKPLKTAFLKLTGQLDRKEMLSLKHLGDALSFRPSAPEQPSPRTFAALKKGLQDCRVVTFKYRNWGKTEILTRTVHPHHVACIDNHWYMFAFDVTRKDLRTFSLSRVTAPHVEPQHFTKPAKFDLDKYLKGSFGVLKGAKDYEIVIELDPCGTDLVRGRKWHPSQQFIELPGGCSQLRLRLSGLDEIERSILSWGTHATVIRPHDLIHRLKTTAEQILLRYS